MSSHLARYVADQIADSREQYSRTNWDYYKGRESAFEAVLKALGSESNRLGPCAPGEEWFEVRPSREGDSRV